MCEEPGSLSISVFLDAGVLERLQRRDPLVALDDDALDALGLIIEGVSHFVCLIWHAQAGRSCTQFELELQAEIDKFALMHELLREQRGRAPADLRQRLFELTGVFTVDGKPLDKLNEERYEIKSAKKLDGYESLWEIVTRIKYGDKDVSLPVEINVEWVGKTPVMVMDSISLPGLGTFSARVVFHDQKYAGTWKHDNVGGHLFGRVDRAPEKEVK